MKDYEKVNQALELLKESKVEFVLAYQNENCSSCKSNMFGSIRTTLDNISGLVAGVSSELAKQGAPKDEFTEVFVRCSKQAIDDGWSMQNVCTDSVPEPQQIH